MTNFIYIYASIQGVYSRQNLYLHCPFLPHLINPGPAEPLYALQLQTV